MSASVTATSNCNFTTNHGCIRSFNSPKWKTLAGKISFFILGTFALGIGLTQTGIVSYLALGCSAILFLIDVFLIYSACASKNLSINTTDPLITNQLTTPAVDLALENPSCPIQASNSKQCIDPVGFAIQLKDLEKEGLIEKEFKGIKIISLSEIPQGNFVKNATRQQVLKLFEKYKTPFLKCNTGEKGDVVLARFALLDKTKEAVEDGFVCITQGAGESPAQVQWNICIYMPKGLFFQSELHISQISSAAWFHQFIKGELVGFHLVEPSQMLISEKYDWILWDPAKIYKKTPIVQLFRNQTFPEVSLEADSRQMFEFYGSLNTHTLQYQNIPIVQGDLKSGEPFYLVHFFCCLGHPVGKGYLLVWKDIKCQGKWRFRFHVYGLSDQKQFKSFSSELINELKPQEIDELKELIWGLGIASNWYANSYGPQCRFLMIKLPVRSPGF